jgi:hypothetical protein
MTSVIYYSLIIPILNIHFSDDRLKHQEHRARHLEPSCGGKGKQRLVFKPWLLVDKMVSCKSTNKQDMQQNTSQFILKRVYSSLCRNLYSFIVPKKPCVRVRISSVTESVLNNANINLPLRNRRRETRRKNMLSTKL